tara:strand:+ start:1353 stop:2264 length:912 start_codon:yes stop_codon:yes gene_type:complete
MFKKLTIIFLFITFKVSAQNNDLGLVFFKNNKENKSFFKENLGKKTIVFFSFDEKKNQIKTINNTHQKLTGLGFDVINYINIVDFYISQEVQRQLVEYFNLRGVEILVFYQKEREKEIKIRFCNYNNKITLVDETKGGYSFFGENVFYEIKKDLLSTNTKQTTFLFSPDPEIIYNINVKKRTRIKNLPKFKKQELGIVLENVTEETKKQILSLFNTNTIEVEEKVDYRFYFSNGINYVIKFLTGTTEALKNIYNLKELKGVGYKKQTILVLENTISQNRYYHFNETPTINKINLTKTFLKHTQ